MNLQDTFSVDFMVDESVCDGAIVVFGTGKHLCSKQCACG